VYEKGVEEFLEFAKQNRGGINRRILLSVHELFEWENTRY